jgi:hypothetical protein
MPVAEIGPDQKRATTSPRRAATMWGSAEACSASSRPRARAPAPPRSTPSFARSPTSGRSASASCSPEPGRTARSACGDRAEGGLSGAGARASGSSAPLGAVAAQAADFVVAVEVSPPLLAHARSAGGATRHRRRRDCVERDGADLALIRVRGGHDFSPQARTLLRRIHRRMDLHRIERLMTVRYLEERRRDRRALAGLADRRERFFRDAEAFQSLLRSTSDLVAAKPAGSVLQLWVLAARPTRKHTRSPSSCSRRSAARQDLESRSCDESRPDRDPDRGRDAIGRHRGGHRHRPARRFFVLGGPLHPGEETAARPSCSPSRTSSTSSVHARGSDLCRNLLIYLLPGAQRTASVFHYSLNPGGLLLLGAGERRGSKRVLQSARHAGSVRRSDSRSRPPMRWTSDRLGRPRRAADSARSPTPDLRIRCAGIWPSASVCPPWWSCDGADQRFTVGSTPSSAPPGRANLNVVEMARGACRHRWLRHSGSAEVGSSIVERTARVKTTAAGSRSTIGRIDDQRLARRCCWSPSACRPRLGSASAKGARRRAAAPTCARSRRAPAPDGSPAQHRRAPVGQ